MTKRACSIDGCGKPHLSKGFCKTHYWRNHRHGSPFAKPSNAGAPLDWLRLHAGHAGEQRLLWPFAMATSGYGSVLYEGKIQGAHRAMCIEAHGHPPTDSHQAAHSCGMGHAGCVNPMHLRWATAAENGADRIRHREAGGRLHRNCKLSDDDCREIIRLRGVVTGKDLAMRFGVDPGLVSRLQRGKLRERLAKSDAAA